MAYERVDPDAPLGPAEQRRFHQTAVKQRTMTNVLLFLIAIPMLLAIVGGLLGVVVCGACSGAMMQGLGGAGPAGGAGF